MQSDIVVSWIFISLINFIFSRWSIIFSSIRPNCFPFTHWLQYLPWWSYFVRAIMEEPPIITVIAWIYFIVASQFFPGPLPPGESFLAHIF